jgi:putative hemolysin
MFTVNEVLADHYPELQKKDLLNRSLQSVLRKLLRENEFSEFSRHYPHLRGMDFIEQVLEHFNFSYTVSDRDRENIPPAGRVVIIANHPIGSLDGLALLKLVHEVRSDVRILANDLLMYIKPMHSCLLPVNNMDGQSSRNQLRRISAALMEEEAVIIFPAGEVSRLRPNGVKDGKWHKGFLSIAAKAKAPILPVHVNGKNSAVFYTASMCYRPLSTIMLVNEMFKQQEKQIQFTVGSIIPFRAYRDLPIHTLEKVKLFKKHLYRLGKGGQPIFQTEKAIARPERRTDLKKELQDAECLGRTPDGKVIYLYNTAESSPVMREIGRLREITFRAVEEGSGKRRDTDRFDSYYHQLILWDESDLEIVGAYRFADAAQVIQEQGTQGLYTDSLFDFTGNQHWFLDRGLELGRSFVQQRYWGKRSLDYLWYGIGAFLAHNPQYRYLFGPVSISNSVPITAKELMIFFYQLYFGTKNHFSCSKNPFIFTQSRDQLACEFSGDDYQDDLKKLKNLLRNMGTNIPTLYKQYSSLCKPGGVCFLDFNVDPDFNNCVDGLVVVDLDKLKEKKRKRYIESSFLTP